jgi:hypothetical protein
MVEAAEKLVEPAPILLDAIHGGVGVFQQFVDVAAVVRADADADARAGHHGQAADEDLEETGFAACIEP